MEIGMMVGDVRGPATLTEILVQVRGAAEAGFSTICQVRRSAGTLSSRLPRQAGCRRSASAPR